MLCPSTDGLSMTVSGPSRERRSVGPLLSTVRLGQPRADALTSRAAVFGYERSAPQGGRLPLETARMAPWVIQGFTSTTPSRALRSLPRQADDTFTCLYRSTDRHTHFHGRAFHRHNLAEAVGGAVLPCCHVCRPIPQLCMYGTESHRRRT